MFFLAKYGTETTFRFPMLKRGVVDLAVTADWTPATGDTKISKDGGNFANATNNPAAVGGTGSVGWTLTLTATELQAAEVNVQIVDSATKAVEDQFLVIYTHGNASAKFVSDFDTISADVAAVHVHAQTIIDDVAAVHVHAGNIDTIITDIHGTDLPAVKTETAAIKAKTDMQPAVWYSA